MAESNRKKSAGLDRPAGRGSFKLWIFFIEIGLGGTVLLVMVGLLWALEPLQQDAYASKGPPKRRVSVPTTDICDRDLYPPPWELRTDQLTILVNGFAEARISLLQESLKKYSAAPVVHSVFVLWGNTSTPDSVLLEAKFESMGAPIYVVRQKSTSLNDRFLPRDYIKTKAVMICDDDITVDHSSLKFALQVWQENQMRIVGFFPRVHSYQLEGHSWVYSKDEHKYSIMLTKIMILSTDYLYRYTCEIPEGVHEYVDNGTNCEDIAMNFLVSNFSGLGPILVEGQPRDWGDTRNSEEELSMMSLSARVGHRKDRGDCIYEFQKLWNGMELRFSYSRAVSNVEEQVLCEKFGQLVDCDQQAISQRDIRRQVGHNMVNRTYHFAYVTLLQSKQMFYSALVLAQSLRSTGTVHDLVLILDANCSLSKDDSTLNEHFDVVKDLGSFRTSRKLRSVGKLTAWQLQEYERVIFLDVNLLVLSNLDCLFNLSEPAAVPEVNFPDQFNTDLLVLQPSNETYTTLLKWRGLTNETEEQLLNHFFGGWYQMPTKHRLPMHFNMPIHMVSSSRSPAVLHFPKRELLLMLKFGTRQNGSKGAKEMLGFLRAQGMTANEKGSFTVWLQLFDALLRNKYHPLDDNMVPQLSWRFNKGQDTCIWPPKLQAAALPYSRSHLNAAARNAFATVVWSVEQLTALAGWGITYSKLHASLSRHNTLLLVHTSVKPESWEPYKNLFDAVVVVDGFDLNSSIDNASATVLHLWNQTKYEKLVYVDPNSIFLDSCSFLMDFEPFAATSNPAIPDTFSSKVMVIEPDNLRFSELLRQISVSRGSARLPMVNFLNQQFSHWYHSSPKHRIGPILNSQIDLQGGLKVDGMPWKILSFYSSHIGLEGNSEIARIWQKYVCSIQPSGSTSALLEHACTSTFF